MHLYIDPSISGISGDMFLGACIEIGLDPAQLESELKKLNLPDPWSFHHRRSERGGITGTRLDFSPAEPHSHAHEHPQPHTHGRCFSEIRNLIQVSALTESVKTRAIAIFKRIGYAEADIHGKNIEEIHFHEVGALDSILDIVGAAVAIELLGIRHITASIPVDGHGTIQCAHGTFPVPAPATLKILEGIRVNQIDVPSELITPTGAAILAELAASFGPMGEATIRKTGYGLGTRKLAGRPNVLRLILCDSSASNSSPDTTRFETDTISMLETNLDDLTGERLALVSSTLMEAGALDVAIVPILMKKARPAHQVQIMCHPASAQTLASQLMRLTGSLGIRVSLLNRWKLTRTLRTVQTPYGSIRVKTGSLGDEVICRKPEADDVAQAAEAHQVPADEVIHAALHDQRKGK